MVITILQSHRMLTELDVKLVFDALTQLANLC